MNQPTATGFGVGQEGGGEQPPLRPNALFDLRKQRVPPGGNGFRIKSVDRRCSRLAINVFAGLAYIYFSSGGGYGELPDLILTEGTHVYEFAPRTIELTIFNGRGESTNDDLFVSVLMTDPHGQPRHECGCGGHK